ncbi:ThiF family adenylyltransferase [Protaetiibacter larvae]|uniref:ThiF family adenylyltransferase n=1 Tax=Protaetiibacter larvae TaxID=2592654 RepID=A0A5C1Y860_9MICO|nr:ThiF family adenylyltransferase [Protaetiibacter larvae]QEO09936.1 ThiF family adenylyltransferase [Protaetiibacter larvae]
MSTSPIARSADLARLRAEGYDIAIADGHLLIRDVPYLDSARTVRLGVFACPLDLAGDTAAKPSTHVMKFSGDYPCDPAGQELEAIRHSPISETIGGVAFTYSFSSKPRPSGYTDYHEKVETYERIVSDQARAVDPETDARTFPVVEATADESVFFYEDTATARAGTTSANARLAGQQVAIIGVGGTGAYILDAVAKTPVAEIHLFDSDDLLTHNAFRAPGAIMIEELRTRPKKVEHWAATYGRLRRGVVAHSYNITAENVAELHGMDVVFLTVDETAAKLPIIEYLEQEGITFIDCGMGLTLTDDDQVRGQLRVTTSTPRKRDHVRTLGRIPLGGPGPDDDYASNIQVGEMNALNAIHAVLRWKKLYGFYEDSEHEHDMGYIIGGNEIINQDPAA